MDTLIDKFGRRISECDDFENSKIIGYYTTENNNDERTIVIVELNNYKDIFIMFISHIHDCSIYGSTSMLIPKDLCMDKNIPYTYNGISENIHLLKSFLITAYNYKNQHQYSGVKIDSIVFHTNITAELI